MAQRFYTLANGDTFKFKNDSTDAVCTKTGPETYRIDRADDPAAVGLKCTVRADAEIVRVKVFTVCHRLSVRLLPGLEHGEPHA